MRIIIKKETDETFEIYEHIILNSGVEIYVTGYIEEVGLHGIVYDTDSGNIDLGPCKNEQIEEMLVSRSKLLDEIQCLPGFIWKDSLSKKSVEISTNLYPVKIAKKWGYIDEVGNIIIEPQFDNAVFFNEHYASVKINENNYFIDKQNNFYLKELEIDHLRILSEGIAGFMKNKKYGYVNLDNEIIIKPQYDFVEDFKEDLAPVNKGYNLDDTNDRNKFGKWGFINKNGKITIEIEYEKAHVFSEGLAAAAIVVDTSSLSLFKKVLYGFIDKKGNFIIEPKYDDVGGKQYVSVGTFSENLAAVKLHDRWGFIDKNGSVKIHFHYKWATLFSEGLAAVQNENNNKFGYINEKGKFKIKPKYDFARKFSEGFASVEFDGKWTFIDKKGKVISKRSFSNTGHFKNGLAQVEEGSKNDPSIGYINTKGEVVWEPQK
jgi:WG repeat protein